MKVGVYNRFWNTAGGGERFAGSIAETLAARHDVTLVAHEPVDTDLLHERLGLGLDPFDQMLLEGTAPAEFRQATEKFDLLFNCSYVTAMPSGARHGVIGVYFPERHDRDINMLQRSAIRSVGHLVRPRGAHLEYGAGFHHPERDGRRRWTWTTGRASLLVFVEEGPSAPFRLIFTTKYTPGDFTPRVVVTAGERVVFDERVANGSIVTVHGLIDAAPDGGPTELTIETDTFVPAALFGGNDWRELGVMMLDVRVGHQTRPGRVAADLVPVLGRELTSLRYLDTYDVVASISQYTAHWIRRYWKRPSTVLYPPVVMQDVGPKRPIILSVGRFFGRKAGHSKKQLEMVQAFRRLVSEPSARGWELHLVGGTSSDHEDYVDLVRDEARGLPVHLHVNASQRTLQELYASASIYWHATGLHERQWLHPARMEHFGISVVEAMSAGAVPVVCDAGGLPEIVEDGVSGFRFRTVDQLVAQTRRLIDRTDVTDRMSASARARARIFSVDCFGERLWELVERVTRV